MSVSSKSFSERREIAKAHFYQSRDAIVLEKGEFGYFDEVYKHAEGDAAAVPWADLEPHPGLAEWIGRSGHLYEGTALDVACGLGDNAEALAHLGYQVTAFDISPTAISWAHERFSNSSVNYLEADLFNAPEHWNGAFDLVHETYTLQALPDHLRNRAMHAISRWVAPGGSLLIVCRSRVRNKSGDVPVAGPPWPLTREELQVFKQCGLVERNFQEFIVRGAREVPHFRVEFERPS